MKNRRTSYQLMISLILLTTIMGCKREFNEVTIEIKGPFTKEIVTKNFGLDSLPFKIDSRDLYFAKLVNNTKSNVVIENSFQNQIFPDSTWFHTYSPFSSLSRTWSPMKQVKPNKGLYRSELKPNDTKIFWFSSYYDEYIDSMSIYFTVWIDNVKSELFVSELYDGKDKPKIRYELIESQQTIDFAKKTQIDIKVDGPYTYEKVNELLNVSIPFTNDSEEVFVFNIKNNRDENLYIERWENDEINIDTIYSYSPFTLTASEYLWNQNTSKKGTKPIDTLELRPQESYKFWDSYNSIWPTTDSIAFIENFRTDKYLINGIKLFEVKKY